MENLLRLCPVAAATSLHDKAEDAARMGLGSLHVKDERERMGMGSFKALGAAFVIAREAEAARRKAGDDLAWEEALRGQTFLTASAGNHGLSVVAGARIFGATSVIYLSETVPASFAERLRGMGAEVVIEGADYEASMAAAEAGAVTRGATLLRIPHGPGMMAVSVSCRVICLRAGGRRCLPAAADTYLSSGRGRRVCRRHGSAFARCIW